MAAAKDMKSKADSKSRNARTNSVNGRNDQTPEELYNTAVKLAEQSQSEDALLAAKTLWNKVKDGSLSEGLPALNLLGEISLELGDADAARGYFEEAVRRDPQGDAEGPLGGGAEKFLWLAQLCEEGGKESVSWFEKGAQVLEKEIALLNSGAQYGLDADSIAVLRTERKARLANALCGMIEVYMTDLSWEEDAEERCEKLITNAMTVEDETSPEVLQTLASIRLSQDRKEDAQAALQRSLESWIHLDADSEDIPDFAARISLARLLMESELEDTAMDVLERLVLEDDQSVEAWYLGGWCQYLEAERIRTNLDSTKIAINTDDQPELELAQRTSRRWLNTALKLYDQIEYEDDRLREHALELVTSLNDILGPEEDDDQDQEEEWEGIEDPAEDEEMKDV